MAADTVMAPVHPGEILLEEFLKPLAVSQYKLAKEIGVPARGPSSRLSWRPTVERRFLTTTVSWFTSVPARSHFATIAEAMGAGLLRVFSGTSRRLLARAGHGR